MQFRRWRRTLPRLLGRLRILQGGAWRSLRKISGWLWRRRQGLVKLLLLGLLLAVTALVIRARNPARRAALKAAQARLLQENRQPEAALPLLAEAVALQPEAGHYAQEEAAALASLGRHEQAELVLRAALARIPGDVGLESALGEVLLRRGHAAEALALLAPLAPRVRTHPDASFACQALTTAAEAHARQGDLAQAERLLREALSRKTPLGTPAAFRLRERARLGLVEVLVLQRRSVEAEGAIRQGLAEVPFAPGLRLALARLLSSTGRMEEAALLLEALIVESKPPLRLDAAVVAVDLRIRLGQGERALEVTNGLPEAERRVAATYARGVIALARGQPGPARSAFEELAALLPAAARPLLLAARAAVQGAQLQDARTFLIRALQRDPSDREVMRALLELEERLGDLDQVRARAEGLLEDPVLRALGVRTLFALHARRDDAKGGLLRLEALASRYPQDLAVQTYLAIFRILAGEIEEGVTTLTRLSGESGLPSAFALLASAREGTSDALEAIELLASLAEGERAFEPARLVLAQIYERLGRLDLAVREVEAAIAHDPSSTEPRLMRARLALQTEDVSRALAELEALKAAGTPLARFLPLYDLLADRLLASTRDPRKDEVDLVVRLLQEVARLAPDRAAAQARLARALQLQGALPQAREAYNRALALGPEIVGAHGAAAIDLLEGRSSEAIARLRAALVATSDPRFGAALAAALALEGHFLDARAALLPWLSVAGNGPEPRCFDGLLLALGGERQQAESALAGLSLPEPVRRATLDPVERPSELREVLEHFALLGLGLTCEARERSARALTADAGPLLLWWAERPLRQGGDPRLRVRLARRLYELCPGSREAALSLVEALTAAEELAQARDVLTALAPSRAADPELDARLGLLCQRLGQLAEAQAAYERAVAAASPAPLVALNNLANLLARDPTRLPEALNLARRAWERGADRSETWDTLGWTLFLAGQHEEAEAHLAWSATLSPSNPTIRYHLARTLVARGRHGRALNHLRLALLLGRPFSEGAEAQNLLGQLESGRAVGGE